MSRLEEINARAEQVQHWTSTSIEQAMARLASSAADVPWLIFEVERLTDLCDEFRKREESQDRIRQRLTADVERLRGWIDRSERQEARARRAEAEVARLTAERDALAAQVARVEALAERFDSVLEEHLLQDDCQCEMKDCYECGPWHACTHNGPPSRARQIRDALAGSESDTGAEEAGHRCEPYYSRAECGQCGWQEQWCVTCSRQMCGCATDAMGADQ